jgi:hypothetical protein
MRWYGSLLGAHPVRSLVDGRDCPYGLVVEVASGCFAELSGREASCKKRSNLAPDPHRLHDRADYSGPR